MASESAEGVQVEDDISPVVIKVLPSNIKEAVKVDPSDYPPDYHSIRGWDYHAPLDKSGPIKPELDDKLREFFDLVGAVSREQGPHTTIEGKDITLRVHNPCIVSFAQTLPEDASDRGIFGQTISSPPVRGAEVKKDQASAHHALQVASTSEFDAALELLRNRVVVQAQTA